MPGAWRNRILRCSCSQEAVPGANVAVLELQIHWGRLNFRSKSWRGHGRMRWLKPAATSCTFCHREQGIMMQLQSEFRYWSSVDQKHCSANMKPVGCRWETLLFQHADDPQDCCGSSTSAFLNSGVWVYPRHYSLISLFTVKKESSFYSSLLHTCLQFLQLLRRALLREFKVPQRDFPFLISPKGPRLAWNVI